MKNTNRPTDDNGTRRDGETAGAYRSRVRREVANTQRNDLEYGRDLRNGKGRFARFVRACESHKTTKAQREQRRYEKLRKECDAWAAAHEAHVAQLKAQGLI